MLRTPADFIDYPADTADSSDNAFSGGAAGEEKASRDAKKGSPEAVILSEEDVPDADGMINVTPAKKKKSGFFARLFNDISRETLMARAKDIGAGMAVSGLARYAVIGSGMAVGLSGVPIVLGGAVAAGVARTVWTMHKERKAHVLETGEDISFLEWAGQNKKKYMMSLGTSTAFATLGSAFMTYAVPHIEQWAAPVVERVMKSETVAAVGGFFTGLWHQISPPAGVPAPKASDVLNQAEHPVVSPDAIQRRIEDAHNAVRDAAPAVAAPVLTVSDKISALADHADLSRRWAGIVEHAVQGDAQSQKDVASAVLNGTHGFDKNPVQAAEIYRAAADAGNMQAKADLAYMQFHGLGGIKADTKAALETLREHAESNKYVRSVLQNLTGEGAAQRTANIAASRALELDIQPQADLPVTIIEPAPGDLSVDTPSLTPVTAEGQIPDNAKLNITWNQNAEGLIEGTIRNAPEWLKDGMVISVPTARVQ